VGENKEFGESETNQCGLVTRQYWRAAPMSYLPFALMLYSALVFGQQVLPAAPPKELPSDRVVDSYGVYAAALRNPVGIHPDTAKTYFVSDHTGQSYGLGDECAHAPEGSRNRV